MKLFDKMTENLSNSENTDELTQSEPESSLARPSSRPSSSPTFSVSVTREQTRARAPVRPPTALQWGFAVVTLGNLISYCALDYLTQYPTTQVMIAEHPFLTVADVGWGISWRFVVYGIFYGLSLSVVPRMFHLDDILGNTALGIANYSMLNQMANVPRL